MYRQEICERKIAMNILSLMKTRSFELLWPEHLLHVESIVEILKKKKKKYFSLSLKLQILAM